MTLEILPHLKKKILRLRFYFYSKRLFLKNQILALWQSRIKSKLFLFGILVYVGLLLFGSFVTIDFLTIDNLQKNIPVLLLSAGAMFGGILAIIFSFGTLLMQNAAGSSSAGFKKPVDVLSNPMSANILRINSH